MSLLIPEKGVEDFLSSLKVKIPENIKECADSKDKLCSVYHYDRNGDIPDPADIIILHKRFCDIMKEYGKENVTIDNVAFVLSLADLTDSIIKFIVDHYQVYFDNYLHVPEKYCIVIVAPPYKGIVDLMYIEEDPVELPPDIT